VPRRKTRQKLSTTISPESYAFLQAEVRSGRAENAGQALDRTVAAVRRARRRSELERQTAEYFAGMSPEAARQEAALETTIAGLAGEVDFDAG